VGVYGGLATVPEEPNGEKSPDTPRSDLTEEGALVDETIRDTAAAAMTEADRKELQEQDSRDTAAPGVTEAGPQIMSGTNKESQADSLYADASEALEGPLTTGRAPPPLPPLRPVTPDKTIAAGTLEGSPVECHGSAGSEEQVQRWHSVPISGSSPAVWHTQLIHSSSASQVNYPGSAVAHEDMDVDMAEHLQSMPISASSPSEALDPSIEAAETATFRGGTVKDGGIETGCKSASKFDTPGPGVAGEEAAESVL